MKNENRKVFAKVKDSSKLNNILLNIVLAIMVGFIGLLIFWNVYPYEIIDWEMDYFQTLKEEYKVGEVLTYRTAFCKENGYIAQQIRRLEDGVVYIFPDLTSSTEEGCYDFVATTTEVPNVPSGEYSFSIEFIYKVNPVREIRYKMETNRFTIINDNNY